VFPVCGLFRVLREGFSLRCYSRASFITTTTTNKTTSTTKTCLTLQCVQKNCLMTFANRWPLVELKHSKRSTLLFFHMNVRCVFLCLLFSHLSSNAFSYPPTSNNINKNKSSSSFHSHQKNFFDFFSYFCASCLFFVECRLPVFCARNPKLELDC
jgi:hypothetical protein